MSTMFSFSREDAADVADKKFDGSMDGDGFTPIPTHWYAGHIIEDKVQPTNGGDGEALNTSWELIGKHHAGRKVFMNIGTKGNEGFVKMGKIIMLSIFDALGINGFKQTGEIHKKPMAIKVVLVPAQYEEDGVTVKYKPKNEIKGIMPLSQLDKLRSEFDAKWPEGYDKMNAKDAPAPVAKTAEAAQDLPDAATAFGADPTPAQTTTAASQAAPVQTATEAPAQFAQQPYAQAEPVIVKAEVAPPVEAAPAVVAPVEEPAKEAWELNGWKQHPQAATHVYKGTEAKTKVEVNAMYAVQAPPVVEAPPSIPGVPEVSEDGEETPPWANGQG